jgi:LysR family hydrogen peroxide-inducible transcriptional activator
LLFDRSRQPVKTTDAGLQLIEIAHQILQKRDQLFLLNNTSSELEGELSIGIIPTTANSLLPLILPSILEENPKLTLKISEITTEDIKQQLLMDKIDLGILATPLHDPRYEEHVLYYEPMMVYGVKDRKKEYVSSKDLKNNKIWLLEEGHCFRDQALTVCEIKEKEQRSSNLNFRGGSFETLLNLSDKFGGYTLIPELYYQTTLSKSKQQRTKHFRTPLPVREISIITYRQHAKNKTIAYLTKVIKEKVSGLLSTTNLANKNMDIIGI